MRLRDIHKMVPIFGKSLLRLPFRHVWYLTRRLRYEQVQNHGGRLYVNTFLPPMPSPAFSRMLDAVIEGQRVPFSTYFAVTDRCPYQCAYCSYGQRPSGQMTTEHCLQVIQEIKGLGTTTLGFSGGEPLLREDLPQLIAAVGPETETIVFTTGFGLDPDLMHRLKTAGLNCLMVGLEADQADLHDDARGANGSFQIALQALEHSFQAGIYTAVSTMATHEKLRSGQIIGIAELASRLGVHEFRILEPVPTGRALGDEGILIDASDRETLTRFHRDWNRGGGRPTIASFSYLESEDLFGCGAGYHHLYIDALGNVCPCDLTPLSFGNVLERSLTEIWHEMGTCFTQPRCGCFAQEICSRKDWQTAKSELPCSPDESKQLCDRIPATELPRVYNNLAKR